MTSELPYRGHLVLAINKLKECREAIFGELVNLFMCDNPDVNEQFKEGEVVHFKLSDFENTEDQNVKNLVQLIKHLDIETDRLININGIEPEELGEE